MEYPISFFSLFIITFAALKVRYYCRMTKKIAIENSREMVEKLKEIRIEDYTYDLPDERIAKFPLENREASKLLIYDEVGLTRGIFTRCRKFLMPGRCWCLTTRR